MHARIVEDKDGRRTAIDACDEPCPIERGMRILGGKWTGSILWHVKDGPIRFNDLARLVSGASRRIITDRLRLLESHGLVRREVVATAPVTVEYQITKTGQTALRFLDELRIWSEEFTQSDAP